MAKEINSVINLVLCLSYQTNSCAALFYAVRQFFAIAIFFMGRLDTYGVGQKLWGGCEQARRLHHHLSPTPVGEKARP